MYKRQALLILYRPDQFSYGQLITFVGYLGMLQGPMDFFSHVFQWWAESMNSAQRIFEIIDSQPEIVESDHPLQMKLKGNIELKHVNFSYEPNKPVLQDVSFSVKAGEDVYKRQGWKGEVRAHRHTGDCMALQTPVS